MIEIDNEETLLTLKVMRRQEKAYICKDYCSIHYENAPDYRSVAADRSKMVDWATNLVDFANMPRSAVELALSYTDRFLMTDDGNDYLNSSTRFQLLVIVSLFLALKIHGSAYVSLNVFQEISRGRYDVDQMQEMERKLLQALQWRVNPPTTSSFLHLYLDLVPSVIMDHGMKSTAFYLSQLQAEYAVRDYSLVTAEASNVALAALKNSLEALGIDYSDIVGVVNCIQDNWGEVDNVDSLQACLLGAISSPTHNLRFATKRIGGSSYSKLSSQNAMTMVGLGSFQENSITPRSVHRHGSFSYCY